MRPPFHQAAFVALFPSLGVSARPKAATTTTNSSPTTTGDSLPIVDLGYELHQALTYNLTSQVYKFQNIRYAQPPVGDLRFRAPVPPKTNRTEIQIGSERHTCPQGVPKWQAAVSGIMGKFYDPAVPYNLTIWEHAVRNAPQPNVNFNAASSEDCLFLDVHVPKTVLESAKSKYHKKKKNGAPVLVWIHGGGYVLGSKSGSPAPSFNPSGLMWHAGLGSTSSNHSPSENMIFVAINYRLGAPGFLSSPSFTREGGTLNAGILDQRLALDWIQSHIHLFGGDKSRVTVMGESAGGGSILIHMASHGGKRGPVPFQQAIPQSPAYMPTATQPSNAYSQFLSLLNVTSLAEARKLPSSSIIAANERQIREYAQTNNYIYGPVIDGNYILAPISTLFQSGKFGKDVAVLAGYTAFEGGIFFDPEVTTNEQFRPWIERSMLGLTRQEIDYLVDVLYPPVYDEAAKLGYEDVQSRQMALWGEAVIDCNFALVGDSLLLSSSSSSLGKNGNGKGKKGQNWAYQFAVRPGFHIQDTKYLFNDPTSPARFGGVQGQMQSMIVGFVKEGVPKLPSDGTEVEPWGGFDFGKKNGKDTGIARNIVKIDETGLRMARSEVNVTRCAWWSSFQAKRGGRGY